MKRWFQLRLRPYIKKPKDRARAMIIRNRLSFVYAFAAWNMLGLIIIAYVKNKYPPTSCEKKIPALWYLRLIGEKHANVVTFEGLSTKSYEYYDAASNTLTPVETDSILPTFSKIYQGDEKEVVKLKEEFSSSEFDYS